MTIYEGPDPKKADEPKPKVIKTNAKTAAEIKAGEWKRVEFDRSEGED